MATKQDPPPVPGPRGRRWPKNGARFAVTFNQEGVGIRVNGFVCIFWTYGEIEEDKETGLQVAEAVRQAYQDPARLYALLHFWQKLPGQAKH